MASLSPAGAADLRCRYRISKSGEEPSVLSRFTAPARLRPSKGLSWRPFRTLMDGLCVDLRGRERSSGLPWGHARVPSGFLGFGGGPGSSRSRRVADQRGCSGTRCALGSRPSPPWPGAATARPRSRGAVSSAVRACGQLSRTRDRRARPGAITRCSRALAEPATPNPPNPLLAQGSGEFGEPVPIDP